ncbi:hypothetical protein AnigIFM63309_004012 [Aspergillus niger]|nr:hypothetical protein AnigIFM63309_004012 [Aspergillus niger]
MSAIQIPPETWRHLLRSLLRECTYLPDPVARVTFHTQILQRFRRYTQKKETDQHRLLLLRKSATHQLSLLKRANEGYTKPLEKVLQQAYGRRGRRRQELIQALVTPADAVDALTAADAQTVAQEAPGMFEDGWRPPSVMVDLLKAQNRNSMITTLNAGYYTKQVEPVIPAENIWGKPLAPSRRRNIRRKWYNQTLQNLFPPLPDSELKVLEGLMSGTIPWAPPKRRKAVGAFSVPVESTLDAGFLTEGPQKGDTFEDYVDGRPHNITRRFMQRLWKRISCLVPRVNWDTRSGKPAFTWDVLYSRPKLALKLDESTASELFAGIDANGRIIKEQPKEATG